MDPRLTVTEDGTIVFKTLTMDDVDKLPDEPRNRRERREYKRARQKLYDSKYGKGKSFVGWKIFSAGKVKIVRVEKIV